MHMVLWTGKSSDELLQHPSLVSAQIPNQRDDPDLYALVTHLQIHNCGNYCRRENNDPNHPCRFGFPHRAQPVAMFDPVTNRSIYKRSYIDTHVNPYCPYLLKLLRVSMDILVNYTRSVIYYLAKCMSKVDQTVDVEYGMETQTQHFQARQIGAVDAAYMLAGWSKHRSSRGTIFISVAFPGRDERRLLKPKVAGLGADATDIFSPTHIEKYQARDRTTRHLTMVEYFCLYKIVQEEGVAEEEEIEVEEDSEEEEDVIEEEEQLNDDTTLEELIPGEQEGQPEQQQEQEDDDDGMEDDDRLGYNVRRPNECVDGFRRTYTVRKRARLPSGAHISTNRKSKTHFSIKK